MSRYCSAPSIAASALTPPHNIVTTNCVPSNAYYRRTADTSRAKCTACLRFCTTSPHAPQTAIMNTRTTQTHGPRTRSTSRTAGTKRRDFEKYLGRDQDQEGFEAKFISEEIGFGVFTTRSFDKGDFLLEYKGEVMSEKEASSRHYTSRHSYQYFFRWNGKSMCIDATTNSSLARLVNDAQQRHKACNVKITKIDVGPTVHLCLFALRDIKQGEELRYDYQVKGLWWRTASQQKQPSVSQATTKEQAKVSCSTEISGGQPAIWTADSEAASCSQPVSEVASSRDQPVSEVASSRDEPVSEVVSSRDQPVSEVAASSDQPVSEVASSRDQPVNEVAASCEPVSEVAASCDEPVTDKVAASCDEPVSEVAASRDQPVSKVAASCNEPVSEVAASRDQPVSEVAASCEPVSEVASSRDQPVSEVASSRDQPVSEVAASCEPVSEVAASCDEPVTDKVAASCEPVSAVAASCDEPVSEVAESVGQ
ncbi:uncharacterized protein LOC119731860 [Patiria miniata]|uniref:SET domain-containing protein n=1 Tax=Patiria miniata TaxID=46514 RepID=A0A914AB20_PATMI|nr:uncharacterized protein LOC119731860 [Patiria miniata]